MKGSMMKIISAGCLLAGFVGFNLVACTDYVQELENEYSYLRDEEEDCVKTCDGDEECEDACEEKEVEKLESSSSKKGDSSSSGKGSSDGKSSSSGKGNGSSGSADSDDEGDEVDAPNPTCEEQAFTKAHALPLRRWGYMGYVIPLKITKGDVQELYLSLGGEISGIQGPDAWTTYGVALGQVDASGSWQFDKGTVLSRNSESAIPYFDVNGSIRGVYTYGQYVKFEFDTKGTWLEKNAGKTINVGVNFYAPGVGSDSSGFGFDYYSVPSDDSTGLYYAYEDNGCRAYAVDYFKYFSCGVQGSAANNKVVNKSVFYSNEAQIYTGDTLEWTLAWSRRMPLYYNDLDSSVYKELDLSWEFENGVVGSTSLKSAKVSYGKPGSASGFVTVSGFGMSVKVPCDSFVNTPPYATIEVVPAPLSGCVCSVDKDAIDVTAGEKATYSVAGCRSDADLISYKWNEGVTAISAGVGTKAITDLGYTSASVTVSDSDGSSMLVTCPKVRGYDLNRPDYLLTSEKVAVPASEKALFYYQCLDNPYRSPQMTINSSYPTTIRINDEVYKMDYYLSVYMDDLFPSCPAGETKTFWLETTDSAISLGVSGVL